MGHILRKTPQPFFAQPKRHSDCILGLYLTPENEKRKLLDESCSISGATMEHLRETSIFRGSWRSSSFQTRSGGKRTLVQHRHSLSYLRCLTLSTCSLIP